MQSKEQMEANLNLAIKAVEFGMPALRSDINKTIIDLYQAYNEQIQVINELNRKIEIMSTKAESKDIAEPEKSQPKK